MPAASVHPPSGASKEVPRSRPADTPNQTGLASPMAKAPQEGVLLAAFSCSGKLHHKGAAAVDLPQTPRKCHLARALTQAAPGGGTTPAKRAKEASKPSGGARYLPIKLLSAGGPSHESLDVHVPRGARKPRSVRPRRCATHGQAAPCTGQAGIHALAMALGVQPAELAAAAAAACAGEQEQEQATARGRILKRPFWMSSCATVQEQQAYLAEQQRRMAAAAAVADGGDAQQHQRTHKGMLPLPEQHTSKQASSGNQGGNRTLGTAAAAAHAAGKRNGQRQAARVQEGQAFRGEDEDAAAALLALFGAPADSWQAPGDKVASKDNVKGKGSSHTTAAGPGVMAVAAGQQQKQQQQMCASKTASAEGPTAMSEAANSSGQEQDACAHAVVAAASPASDRSEHGGSQVQGRRKGNGTRQQQDVKPQLRPHTQQPAAGHQHTLQAILQLQQQQQTQALDWLARAGVLRRQTGQLDAVSSRLWLQWQAVLHCYTSGQVGQAMQGAQQLGAVTAACLRSSGGDVGQ